MQASDLQHSNSKIRLGVIMMKQDDPKKCTAAKMVKFGLALQQKHLPKSASATVLNPYAESSLVGADAKSIRSITCIDCSWRLAQKEFDRPWKGMHKKLPPLLAGNPVNYAKVHKLSTVEALAGALFILGRTEQAHTLLSKFVWGHTFYELNAQLLADYAKLKDPAEIPDLLQEYGMTDPSSEK